MLADERRNATDPSADLSSRMRKVAEDFASLGVRGSGNDGPAGVMTAIAGALDLGR